MKNEIIESLRQKYDHQTYEEERVGTERNQNPRPPCHPETHHYTRMS